MRKKKNCERHLTSFLPHVTDENKKSFVLSKSVRKPKAFVHYKLACFILKEITWEKDLHCPILPYRSAIESRPPLFVVHPYLVLRSTSSIVEVAFLQAVHSFSAQHPCGRACSTASQSALNTVTTRTVAMIARQLLQASMLAQAFHVWTSLVSTEGSDNVCSPII